MASAVLRQRLKLSASMDLPVPLPVVPMPSTDVSVSVKFKAKAWCWQAGREGKKEKDKMTFWAHLLSNPHSSVYLLPTHHPRQLYSEFRSFQWKFFFLLFFTFYHRQPFRHEGRFLLSAVNDSWADLFRKSCEDSPKEAALNQISLLSFVVLGLSLFWFCLLCSSLVAVRHYS